MHPDEFARVEAALDRMLDLEAGERTRQLAELRAEDPGLAERVEELLALDRIAGVLDRPALELAGVPAGGCAAAKPGDRFGAWMVISHLGSGGMGEVFEVERTDGAFRGRAALKLVRRGFEDQASEARFRTERELLAELDHPGVARILDGGTDGSGRPFYVMELVKGDPITKACRSLPLRERLLCVVQACRAVEAAHQSFIVHRDLKPANILVRGDRSVKLLDFGIAKALEPGRDATRTRLEDRALTPAYAAPEQILGEAISTSTDVYSLGVVLFEVLTGRLPRDRQAASLTELVQSVDREVAPRPSACVELDAGLTPRVLRGDLDAIAQRALAREPARRYRTAAALADDIERHLEGRPVAARPDSVAYGMTRFVKRHAIAAALTVVAIVSLVSGLAVAIDAARLARAEADRASAEARRADEAADEARVEQARATAIKEFVLSILREASPLQRERGRALEIREILDLTEERIDRELAGQPLLQADLWDDLAETRAANGDLERARALVERALAAKREHLAATDPSLAESLANRASFAVLGSSPEAGLADADEALAILAQQGAGSTRLAAELATIRTNALAQLGRTEEALAEARRAFVLHGAVNGEDHHETTMQLSNVAMLELKLGLAGEARDTFGRVIVAVEREVGPDHGLLFYPYKGLGRAALALGDLDGAFRAQSRALELARSHFGAESRPAAEIHAELGRIAKAAGRSEDARREFVRALDLLRVSAPTNPLVGELAAEIDQPSTSSSVRP